MPDRLRRLLLKTASALPLAAAPGLAAAATPRQAEGPFYPTGAM